MFVLAQDAGSSLTGFLPILLIGAVFYFLVIRPQRKRQKERTDMLSDLAVGSEVVTIGGLFGEVEALDDNWVDLLVSEDVVLRFTRQAIGRIVTPEDERTLETFATGEDPDELDAPDDRDDDVEDAWPTDDQPAGDLEADETSER
ncbi:preprotein translocase subunit YajC [Salsipaludibacter albus]|uniref:preprotein translocase subunit YajC n=1 Tax=Salsipaludibacter albus TaxID=2849650 RepID=UPI001EE40CF0|nr:preprotein translocase subunit YajC [Salsipaludibacter albus]MBY5163959.1 preprotein translocase subunit YajC [Salsipaludibacter albus]